MEVTAEITIPSEAVEHVIGGKRAHIGVVQTTPGLVSCILKATTLNAHTLYLTGSQQAIDEATAQVNSRIKLARRLLENSMREHSWTLTSDGRMRTPREVHQTGHSAPRPHTTGVGRNHYAARKQGKRFEKEAERADQLRREAGMTGRSGGRDSRTGWDDDDY